MKKFAVFDIDGTVIRWQLYHGVVNELAKQGHLSADANEFIHTSRMTWKRREGETSFRDYEHALVHVYHDSLTNLKVSDYLAAIDKVFDEYKDQTYTYTRDLIHELKSKGYLLLAISGSQQEIISKLADYYGFDEAVGTVYERTDGHFTGKSVATNRDKDKILKDMLTRYEVTTSGSIAVGDSESDIPMLEAVEIPIAFNPSKLLFQHAKKQGWEMVIERKNVVYKLGQDNGRYLLEN